MGHVSVLFRHASGGAVPSPLGVVARCVLQIACEGFKESVAPVVSVLVVPVPVVRVQRRVRAKVSQIEGWCCRRPPGVPQGINNFYSTALAGAVFGILTSLGVLREGVSLPFSAVTAPFFPSSGPSVELGGKLLHMFPGYRTATVGKSPLRQRGVAHLLKGELAAVALRPSSQCHRK